ncbi:MAG: hypothetical protein KDC27_07195 [Acidobacteria bacterium]|nr:hypothetical protein [Acidobacteriota bacterium]
MHARRHAMTLLALACLAGAAVWANRPAPKRDGLPDPVTMRLEYRPGAWLPPGLELNGTVRLLTAPVVEMGQRHRVRIEYTVGDREITAGESVEIWKHFTSDVEEFQVDDSSEPAFFGVETTATGVKFETRKYLNSVQRNEHSVFPYRKAAALVVESGSLKKGDKVIFDLGGAQGVRMQFYSENLFNFRVAITNDAEKKVLAYGGDAYMKVIGGPLAKLKVQAPSIVGKGEPFTVEVVPMDEWVSLAKDGAGLEFEMISDAAGASDFQYDPELLHYVAHNVVANKEGVSRIRVRTKDGRFAGVSNPIWTQRKPERRVYFGDLHQHTYLGDGRGIYEELYLFARQVAMLDFGAITPHQETLGVSGPILRLEDQSFPGDYWPELVQANKTFKGWKGFTPILAYEYSVGTKAGGHHNVFYADDEARSTMEIDPNKTRAPVGEMMKLLRGSGERALVIPHIGGGPPSWTHETDPRLERLFEIASVHGVFEESYQKHLESGQRVGATASADNHTVGFGQSNPGLIYTMTNPLTAVMAYSPEREDLWEAMTDRHTYGVTGNARLLMDFRVNDEPMGGELPRTKADSARIVAKVSGVDPILRLEIVKNNQTVHTVTPGRDANARLMRIVWADNYYQRRANTSLADGEIRASQGRVTLERVLNQDNSFEWFRQDGDRVAYHSATTSNDLDGVLVDISGATGDEVVFRRSDPMLGDHEVRIPLAALKRDGVFSWRSGKIAGARHPYLEEMGMDVELFVEAELISPAAPLDVNLMYEHREAMKPGDYYYLRVQQLDTVKAWSSPVWAN